MTGKTHLVIGVASALALSVTSPVALVVAGVGALAPDIDHPGSKISRRVTPGKLPRSTIGRFLAGFVLVVAGGMAWTPLLIPGLAMVILAGIPHRGFIHSPAFALVVGAAAYHLSGMDGGLVVAFTVGYLSHLMADSLTNHGIPVLWPITNERYGVGLVRTDSIMEGIILIGSVAFIGLWGINATGIVDDINNIMAVLGLF